MVFSEPIQSTMSDISPLGCNGLYRACEGTNLTERAV